ncbi:MAG: TolC family protein [Thiobacillaceae bacterium]|nr:TolC family protein [Thiobacillaceae bacterium]
MMLPAARRLALATALALTSAPALAETLDFRQCVETALAQNPDLSISRSQIDQAEAGLRQAEGGRLPRLNLSLTATHTNDPLNAFGLKLSQERIGAADFIPATLNDPKAVDNLNTRVELLWPVYTGGQVQSYVAQAQAQVRAAQSGDQAARQQLIRQVLMAYQGVHTARAFVSVAEESLSAAQEYARITERMHRQGLAVKSDMLSARVHLEDARVRLAEARNGVASALDRLRLLLGKSLDDALDVGAPVMPGMPDGGDADLRRQAIANHDGLRALRNQMEAAGAQVEAARAGHRPQVNVVLRQDWNDDKVGLDASSYTVAGVLSWTLFDGGATRAGVDRAEAGRMELAARLRQAEDGVSLQVSEARRKSLEAETRIQARELAVEQAEEARRLVRKRYENGMATLVELLAAQAQLDKARADLVGARQELASQRAELLRVVGMLRADLP